MVFPFFWANTFIEVFARVETLGSLVEDPFQSFSFSKERVVEGGI